MSGKRSKYNRQHHVGKSKREVEAYRKGLLLASSGSSESTLGDSIDTNRTNESAVDDDIDDSKFGSRTVRGRSLRLLCKDNFLKIVAGLVTAGFLWFCGWILWVSKSQMKASFDVAEIQKDVEDLKKNKEEMKEKHHSLKEGFEVFKAEILAKLEYLGSDKQHKK